nr:tetratricopeptide repeat (TPR)-like superfamily protein [Tanacetum cinerariifolium]
LHNEMNVRKQHLAFSPAAQGIHLPRLRSTVTVISLMRGEMESGSHLSALRRLYAWEKKLYDEVKVNKEPDSPLAELDPPVKEEPTKEKPQVASKVQPLEETGAQNPVSASDAFPKGEEGWQAVHRPGSAGLHG